MSAALKRIRDGETDLRLEGLGGDEVGEVGRAVNEMLDRIQELVAEEYAAELLLRQAEYRALQSQVNPHFLYNSLDTVSGLAQARGCPEVGDLCRALSNVFRYSVGSADSLAAVKDEILNVKNYMYVMNARMNGAVELAISVDPALLQERVPRLCLQPLVENAVLHGLKDKRGEKRIAIRGEMGEARFELAVEDNGVGIGEARIAEVLAPGTGDSPSGESSIGLRNIDARFKLLFGEAYGLSLWSRPGEGCRASLSAPRRTAPPEGSAP
jgi:sensor histidine kinase YesM